MKAEDKKHILENINKKSAEKIAAELGIKQRKINKFLKQQKNKKQRTIFLQETLNKRTLFLSAILIILLGFAIYANILNGEFLWDDFTLVKNNLYIRSFSNIVKIFTQPIGAGGGGENTFYRPLQMLSYMADYAVWKLDVTGYHLTNILLHIFAALCVYGFINILFADNFLALISGFFFVVHPIHTEAVAYISGRADSLALIFMLLCFVFYIKTLRLNDKKIYVLMLANYALALLSRENSLILPALFWLYHYVFREKFYFKKFAPLLVTAFVYILLRLTLLNESSGDVVYPTSMWQRLPGFFIALTNYFRLLFLPFDLHMQYGSRLFNFSNPQAIIGILIAGSILIFTLKQKENKLARFSILWFFIALLPVSNLYPINAYMAEHWLYLPSIGLFTLAAAGLNVIYQKEKFKVLALGLIIGFIFFYGGLTINQNKYWREPVTFFERTLKYAPEDARIYYNLGFAYLDAKGDREKAISLYKKAIEINPNYERAYSSLGSIYDSMDRKDEAMEMFKKAIETNPRYADGYYNLGTIHSELGKKDEALKLLSKAIELNPVHIKAYNNLANIYKDKGQYQKAIVLYKKALEINPACATVHNNLSGLYEALKAGKNRP